MRQEKNRRFPEGRTRILSRLYPILGILCVAALFGAAMLFPGYYSTLYDKNTLNQASFTDISVDTYETSYDSFVGKLHALAKAHYEVQLNTDMRMSAVRTNELNMAMDKRELTKIVQRELGKLHELHVLVSELKPKAKRLTQYDRYTIYASQEAGGMKGISCWRLVYENAKRTITLYLDEEYHKIYSLDIFYKDKEYENSSESIVWDVSGNKIKDADGQPGSIADEGVDAEDKGMAYDGLITYYDIMSYQEGTYDIWRDEITSSGVIGFDDGQYVLRVFKKISYDDHSSRYRIGIPLEKMIQF